MKDHGDRALEFWPSILRGRGAGLTEMQRLLAVEFAAVAAEARRDMREEAALLCDVRAKEKDAAASDLAEHYGPEADAEVSMYYTDAAGATALAVAIRALLEVKP